MIPKLYRVSEAADILRVSPRQVRRYLDAGEIPFVHLHKRNRAGVRLVAEPELARFLNRHSVGRPAAGNYGDAKEGRNLAR